MEFSTKQIIEGKYLDPGDYKVEGVDWSVFKSSPHLVDGEWFPFAEDPSSTYFININNPEGPLRKVTK